MRKHGYASGCSSVWLRALGSGPRGRRFKSFHPDLYHVYVLRGTRTRRLYTGSCEDVDDPLMRHNAGQSRATKHGVPWKLVHCEEFATRGEAVRREAYLKTGRGRDELRQLLS